MKLPPILAALAVALAAPSAFADTPGHSHSAHGSAHWAHSSHAAPLPPEAQAEIAALRAAIARFRDPAVAEAEGWKRARIGGDDTPLMGEHWVNDAIPPYGPGEAFDPARPNVLQYVVIGGQRVLAGVAFSAMLRPGDPPPEGFTGSADRWHLHDAAKIVAAATEGRPRLARVLKERMAERLGTGAAARDKLWMIHVWTEIPAPGGPFAHFNHALPYLRAGLPPEWAAGTGETEAQGVGYAAEDGCELALDGRLWIAGATRAQRREIGRVCDGAAEVVREAIVTGDREAVSQAARAAGGAVASAIARVLDENQRARLASLIEHR